MALKKSLAQVKGSLSSYVMDLEQQLLKALALSEASFEFLDEEMDFHEDILRILINIQNTITHLKKNFDQQLHLRQGMRIALIG